VILDSSAIVAILCREPGHEDLLEQIEPNDVLAVSAATLAETAVVLSIKWRRDPRPELSEFLDSTGITVVPFTRDHVSFFMDGYLRYGKGRHPAALNLGDCFAYATVKMAGQRLLFVGDDFTQTDMG
jgi:ribonuclease VapC